MAAGSAELSSAARCAWDAPWFAALRPMLDTVGDDALAGRWQRCLDALNGAARASGLAIENGRPLAFVDAREAGGSAYEDHIWRTGHVPTRLEGDGAWHDLFNALTWLAFPRTKARLNALQATEIARDGVGARRGGLRDAATLFDENAALVFTGNAPLVDALRRFDWHALFVRSREAFAREVRVVAFGHALVDKLRRPYKAICAHAWVVTAAPGLDAAPLPSLDAVPLPSLDAMACATLRADALRPDAFAPLPVLGIPGWWPENRDPSFYEDTAVFRSGRRGTSRN